MTNYVSNIVSSGSNYDFAHNLTVVDGGVYFLSVPDFNQKRNQGLKRDTVLYYYKPGNVTATKSITKNSTAAISVYPNPTFSDLTINANSSGRIVLLDETGEAIMERSVDRKQVLSTENLPSGVYFVKFISSDGSVVVKKVLKE